MYALLLVFSVTPFKINQNQNQNSSNDKVQNLEEKDDFRQDSGHSNVSPHISHKKNCCDQNFGESLCIFTFFLFKILDLNIWTVLIFILIYFEWRDTENQQ